MSDDWIPLDVPLTVENGWPPVDVETLRAVPAVPGGFVVESIPVFALDLSRGDTVEAAADPAGRLRFERRSRVGHHATFRLIALGDEAAVARVVERITRLGADVVESTFPALWALDVPPSAAQEPIRAVLEEATTRGIIEFEDARTA